eukprot:CAMPEP_0182619364 /NCGR_PEP_ID=MMETSP1330-20130603/46067_1 /TAXON_ID=464278 /ORGANISM="Picochlorum sp., Strain RCC944" /LENGTH=529 /DNA_ID=CAMNT_0024839599 /DNA_START=185 /DNA_END=1774 /DNA_ORIENTATION=-
MSGFLTDEQRLTLENALGDKRRDEELDQIRQDNGKPALHKTSSNKPSVLAIDPIDPWESGDLKFLRRPSLEERRGSHHEDAALSGKQNLHLSKSPSDKVKSLDGFVPVPYSQSTHAQGGGSGNNKHHHHPQKIKKSIRSKGFWKGLITPPGDSKHYLDENDPNYDPEEDEQYEYSVYSAAAVNKEANGRNHKSENGKNGENGGSEAMDEQTFKFKVVEDLQEFLSSGDMMNFKCSVEELGQPEMHHLLVKRAIMLAFDRGQREREMISQLFSFLYPEVLGTKQFVEGFENILDCIEDILLDHPQAVEMLSLFIARAVIDDILPPSFVQKVRAKRQEDQENRNCQTIVDRILVFVEGHINSRHAAERLHRCWGSGAGRDIDATKASMDGLLKEYIGSQDVEEASRCLSSLKVPFFHHECVKQAIIMMLEEPANQPKLTSLLTKFSQSGLISDHQMSTGFHRVKQRLPDLELDIPQAGDRFTDLALSLNLSELDEEQTFKFKVVDVDRFPSSEAEAPGLGAGHSPGGGQVH